MSHWTCLCRDMHLHPHKIGKKENKIFQNGITPINFQHPHFPFSNEDHESFHVNDDVTCDDLVLYTDGSYYMNPKDENDIFKHGGTGILIISNQKEFIFCQPPGQQQIS